MIEIRELLSDGGRTLTLGTCICILVYVGADRFVDSIQADFKEIQREIKSIDNRLDTLDLANRDYTAFKEYQLSRQLADDKRASDNTQWHKEHAKVDIHPGAAVRVKVLEDKVNRLDRMQSANQR